MTTEKAAKDPSVGKRLAEARAAAKAKRDAEKALVEQAKEAVAAEEAATTQAPVIDDAELARQAQAAAAAFNAAAAGIALPKAEKRIPGKTIFRSARPEGVRIHIDMGDVEVRSSFASDPEFIEFQVPDHLVARFRRHLFVKSGRFIEVP
jgi:hypothetical protein